MALFNSGSPAQLIRSTQPEKPQIPVFPHAITPSTLGDYLAFRNHLTGIGWRTPIQQAIPTFMQANQPRPDMFILDDSVLDAARVIAIEGSTATTKLDRGANPGYVYDGSEVRIKFVLQMILTPEGVLIPRVSGATGKPQGGDWAPGYRSNLVAINAQAVEAGFCRQEHLSAFQQFASSCIEAGSDEMYTKGKAGADVKISLIPKRTFVGIVLEERVNPSWTPGKAGETSVAIGIKELQIHLGDGVWASQWSGGGNMQTVQPLDITNLMRSPAPAPSPAHAAPAQYHYAPAPAVQTQPQYSQPPYADQYAPAPMQTAQHVVGGLQAPSMDPAVLAALAAAQGHSPANNPANYTGNWNQPTSQGGPTGFTQTAL